MEEWIEWYEEKKKEDAMVKRTVRLDVDVDLERLRKDLLAYSAKTLSRATKQAIEGNGMSLVAASVGKFDERRQAVLELRFEYEEVIEEEGEGDGEN